MTETYRKSAARDTLESLVVTVILAIFGTTFVVQAFKIPTGSMEDTLLIGDHLLVNKFIFAYHGNAWWTRLLPYRDIHHDDILVFKYPGSGMEAQEPGEHFVKRVIGVPGDHIRVEHRQVYVNGKALQEPFVKDTSPDVFRPGDDFPPPPGEEMASMTSDWEDNIQNYVKNGELVVPPDSYFVMGDNREQSWDSRFWGFVPHGIVSGRPLLIYWSYETPREEYMQTSLADRLSQALDLVVHFIGKTRWRRTFMFVR